MVVLTTMEVVVIPGHFMAVIVFVHAVTTTGNIQTSASIGSATSDAIFSSIQSVNIPSTDYV